MKPEMQRIKFFSGICLLMVFFSAAQAYPQTTFAKRVTDAGHPHATTQCKDGGYVSFTFWRRVWSPDKSEILVRKVNRSGGMVWEKKLRFNAFNAYVYPWGISQTTDGGYVLVGYPGTVVKLKPNGDLQWAKRFQAPLQDGVDFWNVSPLEHGGFIVNGFNLHAVDNSGWNWLKVPIFVKFNSQGKVVSASRFEHPQITENGYFSQKMVVAQDGGAFLTTTDVPDRVIVMRVDGLGNIVWNKDYEIRGFSFEIASTSDNGAMLAGSNWGTGQVVLLKLNSNGEIEWKERLAFKGYLDITNITQDADGGYLITGDNTVPGRTAKSFVFKADPAGKVVFARIFGGMSYSASIFSISGKGSLVFGSADDWIPELNAETMVLLKLDSTGIVPGCGLFSSMRLFRNPSGDMKISTPKITRSGYSLAVTSVAGKITSEPSRSQVSTECP